MKFHVKGDLKISYFVRLEMTVEAESEEEAFHKAAEEQKEIVEADSGHYLYEMGWEGDSPVVKEVP